MRIGDFIKMEDVMIESPIIENVTQSLLIDTDSVTRSACLLERPGSYEGSAGDTHVNAGEAGIAVSA
jgi:hypothetical protein